MFGIGFFRSTLFVVRMLMEDRPWLLGCSVVVSLLCSGGGAGSAQMAALKKCYKCCVLTISRLDGFGPL